MISEPALTPVASTRGGALLVPRRVRERDEAASAGIFCANNEEDSPMDATYTPEAPARKTAWHWARPRGTLSAIAVAAVWFSLLLGAPLILRYGPGPEVTAAVARVPINEVATPRCAYAPEFGRSCAPVR
jgi:hypothetical protein